MKVVLRHQATGRYYSASGQWVRRADNALTFDDTVIALNYVRSNRLLRTHPVYRLAPYLIPLLHEQQQRPLLLAWTALSIAQTARGNFQSLRQFEQN